MGRFVAIAVAAVAALTLVACGSSTTTVVNNTTTVTAEATDSTVGEASTTDETPAVMATFVGGQELTEPTEFSFSVNGSLAAKDLTWENWGSPSASGSGSFVFTDHPSFEEVVVPGTVTVSGLSECKGTSYYTVMDFDFAAKPPAEPQITGLPYPCAAE